MNDTSAVAIATRNFELPASDIYEAFLTPEIARRFLFATPDGEMVVAKIDPKVGGSFLMTDRRNGEDVEHFGKFLELVHPSKIAFELRVPKYSQDSARITIEIRSLDEGCQAKLTHFVTPGWEDKIDKLEEGWGMILYGLAATLGSPLV